MGKKLNKNSDDVMTKFVVNNRTDALQSDINLFFYDNKLPIFPLSLADASHEFQIHGLSAY